MNIIFMGYIYYMKTGDLFRICLEKFVWRIGDLKWDLFGDMYIYIYVYICTLVMTIT